MVFCPECGVVVNQLLRLKKWRLYFGFTVAEKEGKTHCCYKCVVRISSNYIDKKHTVSLSLSEVK